MKRTTKRILLVLLCTLSAWADFEWPTQSVPIRVNGAPIPAYWKDGVPYAERDKVVHVFHLRSGAQELNLPELFKSQGYSLKLGQDGGVEANKSITVDQVHASGKTAKTAPPKGQASKAKDTPPSTDLPDDNPNDAP